MKPTWGPQRAQAPSRRWLPPVIARELLAPSATARRGKCRVLSLGVLGRVGERAHPGGRRQSEQRRAGVHACHFHDQPQVGACSGPTFRCTPDPQTHIPSPSYTRPTIGMLNLAFKIPSSVSGSSRRSHRAKPRATAKHANSASRRSFLPVWDRLRRSSAGHRRLAPVTVRSPPAGASHRRPTPAKPRRAPRIPDLRFI